MYVPDELFHGIDIQKRFHFKDVFRIIYINLSSIHIYHFLDIFQPDAMMGRIFLSCLKFFFPFDDIAGIAVFYKQKKNAGFYEYFNVQIAAFCFLRFPNCIIQQISQNGA